MPDKKIIAVVGATGSQGGGLVRNEDFCGARDPRVARALNPELQTFEAWLAQNKRRIPLE